MMDNNDDNNDDDLSYAAEIEIGVNPHAETERVYDDFCAELDPIRNRSFLSRVAEIEPGRWELLDDLCASLEKLPDHAAEIIRRSPRKVAICHLPWLGKGMDDSQPDSVLLIGDADSMYHSMMLMNLAPLQEP